VGKEPTAWRRAATAARESRVIKKKGPAVCDDRALKANSENVHASCRAPAFELQTLDVQSALANGCAP
jgi:hypothetical protein